MASDTAFQLISRKSSDHAEAHDALARRQGCDFTKAVSGMSPGEQLDVLRSYDKESKKDAESFPKIDVNFDKKGYEIKANDANADKGTDKGETIASTKFNDNDGVKSSSCQNFDVPESEQVGGHGSASSSADTTTSTNESMNSMGRSNAIGSDSTPATADTAKDDFKGSGAVPPLSGGSN